MRERDNQPEKQPIFMQQEIINPIPETTPKPKLNASGQALRTIGVSALILATLFTIWTPASLLSSTLEERLAKTLAEGNTSNQTQIAKNGYPAGFPTNKIGIVVGHRGNDSGAVCSNGLTEVEINSNVATFVQKKLTDLGYEAELLDEFDARLSGYQAILLISIHADSCEYINDSATGFKVAAALSETKVDNATRLVSCMADRFHKVTGLDYHYQSITPDMTYYHAFNEIDPLTTAAIIETGFMNLDQEILTKKPELIAEGIVEGIQCYLNNEGVEPTPMPTPEP